MCLYLKDYAIKNHTLRYHKIKSRRDCEYHKPMFWINGITYVYN